MQADCIPAGSPCVVPDCQKPSRRLGLCPAHLSRLQKHGDPLAGGPPRKRSSAPVCSVPGCRSPHLAGSYCCLHYHRARQGHDLLAPAKRRYRDQPQCCVDGCDRDTEAHGWCALHYRRWRCNGDPQTVRTTKGQRRSPAYCSKLSAARKGKPLSADHRAAISQSLRGKTRSLQAIEKTSGRNHYRWNGGQPRNLCKPAWRALREQVLARDGYQCRNCGATDRTLIAHHIISYDHDGPDALFNLITWCRPCHARHHNRDTVNQPGR